MTKLSTAPYAYEPGLIARLLGVVLEAVNAYGVRLLHVYMKNRVSRFPLINSQDMYIRFYDPAYRNSLDREKKWYQAGSEALRALRALRLNL